MCYKIVYKDFERDSSIGEILLQRVGDGASPMKYLCVKITRELPAEWDSTRRGRCSSVNGKAYDGTYNRWYSEITSRPVLRGGGFFIFRRF